MILGGSSGDSRARTMQVYLAVSHYRGGGGESRIFLGAAVSHLEGTETSQRAAVWESTGPPPWLRAGIWSTDTA